MWGVKESQERRRKAYGGEKKRRVVGSADRATLYAAGGRAVGGSRRAGRAVRKKERIDHPRWQPSPTPRPHGAEAKGNRDVHVVTPPPQSQAREKHTHKNDLQRSLLALPATRGATIGVWRRRPQPPPSLPGSDAPKCGPIHSRPRLPEEW